MAVPDLVLHIPHASRRIPLEDRAGIIADEQCLAAELLRMTDAWTDKLVEAVALPARRVTFPVSRLVVDPERFADDADEPMAGRGMGAVYTRLSDGRALRHPDPAERRRLLDRYYWPHHRLLDEAVDAALADHGRALIVDVHSFSSVPLPHEPDQDPARPELCVGLDDFHSPFSRGDDATEIGSGAGFSPVVLNRPFAGSIVPARHWMRTPAVRSVMIEIRRDLYMDEGTGARRPDFGLVAARTTRLVEAIHAAWIKREAMTAVSAPRCAPRS
jgi:N-formylglutamate amidohydrolase